MWVVMAFSDAYILFGYLLFFLLRRPRTSTRRECFREIGITQLSVRRSALPPAAQKGKVGRGFATPNPHESMKFLAKYYEAQKKEGDWARSVKPLGAR